MKSKSLQLEPQPFSPAAAAQARIQRLYELLGPGVVLLPIPRGNKACYLRGWRQITYEQSLESEWQAKLLKYRNTGVAMGEPSGGKISIDCDTDDFKADMLKLNPFLKKTLISRGARGANFWLQMTGPYPPNARLNGYGEFRSTGNLTVISGIHPKQIPYTFENEAPVIDLRFEDLLWPSYITPPKLPPAAKPGGRRTRETSTASLSAALLDNCVPGQLRTCVTSAHLIRADLEFREKHPVLYRLMQSLIQPLLPLQRGSRNEVLTGEIAPCLFSAVSPAGSCVILDHLNITDQLGGLPAAEAQEKFAHVWNAMERDYPEDLQAEEAAVYELLDAPRRWAFRICRSLAICEEGRFPFPCFFLSAGELAGRILEPNRMSAWRLLRDFERFGILQTTSRGSRRAKGHEGSAAEFIWNLISPA